MVLFCVHFVSAYLSSFYSSQFWRCHLLNLSLNPLEFEVTFKHCHNSSPRSDNIAYKYYLYSCKIYPQVESNIFWTFATTWNEGDFLTQWTEAIILPICTKTKDCCGIHRTHLQANYTQVLVNKRIQNSLSEI